MIDLKAVDSSVVAAAGYQPEERLLVVLFNTGRAYEYYDVPEEIYDGLMAAESKGAYINQHVIGKFSYDRFQGWKKR